MVGALSDTERLDRMETKIDEILGLVQKIHGREESVVKKKESHDAPLKMLTLIYEANSGVGKTLIEERTGRSDTTIWRYACKFRDLGLLRYEPEGPRSRLNVNQRIFYSNQLTRRGNLLVQNRSKLPSNWWRILNEDGFSRLREKCGF